MSDKLHMVVFGEVLFDCFPGGEQVLGGAPFNVAWHLQAFGDQPQFISRVGQDEAGNSIINAMQQWGMDTRSVQRDSQHPSGRVEIQIIDNEPQYDIKADCAYDFIDAAEINTTDRPAILYHGSLALRNPVTQTAYETLAEKHNLSLFLDVNLRPPWWQKDNLLNYLHKARWVKLNELELQQLMKTSNKLQQDMTQFMTRFDLDLLILTRGEKGATVLDKQKKLFSVKPAESKIIVDTVGAGDAFTAVFLHGLINDWSIAETLEAAQKFASAVVGLRGATSTDAGFYQAFKF